MHATLLVAFLAFARTPAWMCAAGVAIFLIALWAARADVAQARGFDKIVALGNLCFAVPLAVFGALHLSAAHGLMNLVPAYMPSRLFWAYFFGFALLSASLSIATKIQVRWSGFLFGIAMFLFVAMLMLPGAIANPRDRFAWTLVCRESSFGSGGWLLAGSAMAAASARLGSGSRKFGSVLIMVGRLVIGIGALLFGVEHFLHPANVPGVPLEKLMPAWIPGHAAISYLTGAMLLMAGISFLLNKKPRMAATLLGTWLVLLVLFVYEPILVSALASSSSDVQVEGINYFADTLLYGGAILAVASAIPRAERNF